jgi:cytochrome c-type biogenesis protein CcmH/NrfG
VEDILRRRPAFSTALLLKARFLAAERQTEAPLTQASATARADPGSIPARYLLGKLYADANRLDEAEKAFGEVLTQNPRAVAAQLELARVQPAQGRPDAALPAVRAPLRSQPENPDARLLSATALIAGRDQSRSPLSPRTGP